MKAKVSFEDVRVPLNVIQQAVLQQFHTLSNEVGCWNSLTNWLTKLEKGMLLFDITYPQLEFEQMEGALLVSKCGGYEIHYKEQMVEGDSGEKIPYKHFQVGTRHYTKGITSVPWTINIIETCSDLNKAIWFAQKHSEEKSRKLLETLEIRIKPY